METALPGTAPPIPAPLSPDAEVAAGPKRSWRRATRPGSLRRPSARPLLPHPPSSRPGHRHRPRGSAQASPRSRRDGRVGVGCGRCCGRPRQSGAGGCPAAAASHAFTATKNALSGGRRRRAPGCAAAVPARRAPGDDGEEGRSLRTSLR